jgi:hypothetical protein
MLRRLLCEECGKLHTEIPDTIQPYKHYDSKAIQSVLDGGAEAAYCAADGTTMRRWRATFGREGPDISQRLGSVHARRADSAVPLAAAGRVLDAMRAGHGRWLALVMALLINAGHKLRTQFAFRPPRGCGKLGRGNETNTGRGDEDGQAIEDG